LANTPSSARRSPVLLAKPSKASLAAMGSMMIGRVILGAAAGTLSVAALGGAWPVAWLSVIATLGISVWACRLAWRWTRGDERPGRQSFAVVTLAILSVLLVGALAIITRYGSPNVAPLSLPTQGPAPAVAVGSVSARCRRSVPHLSRQSASSRSPCWRSRSVGPASIASVSSTRSGGSNIAWTTGRVVVAGRVDLNGSEYQLHLSPDGQRFAVQSAGRRPARYEDDGDEGR
jgi:hypothetical protein